MGAPGSDKALKSPRTKRDYLFLAQVNHLMPSLNIKSDRAMSRALGQHDSFINRIKTGIQSAPSTVWDILDNLAKTSKLELLTENQIAKRDQSTSRILTSALLDDKPASSEAGQEEIFSSSYYIKELAANNEKIALLTSQLADKERTIQILMDQLYKK